MKAVNSLDVVVLDNKLPYANGMDLLQIIKESDNFKNIPIIMSSADDDYESFKTIGADYYLHKPYCKHGIMGILDHVEG